MNRRATSRRLLLAVACALVGCGAIEPQGELAVATTFPNPATAGATRAVTVRVLDLGAAPSSPCVGLLEGSIAPNSTGLDTDEEATRELADDPVYRPTLVGFVFALPYGTKAVYAEAVDGVGLVTLRGCETTSVGEGSSLEIALRATAR